MQVGHNRALAGVVLAAGAMSLGLGLIAGTMASIAVGAVVMLMGVLYIVNPMAVVHDSEIEIKNPFGMTMKRVSYGSRKDLVVRDGRVFVRCGSTEQTTGVGGFMVNRADLDALARWVSNG